MLTTYFLFGGGINWTAWLVQENYMPRGGLGCFLRRAVRQSVLSQSHLSCRPDSRSLATYISKGSFCKWCSSRHYPCFPPHQQAGLRLFGERRQSTWQGMHEERVDWLPGALTSVQGIGSDPVGKLYLWVVFEELGGKMKSIRERLR